jgi:SAM-dependent methyltransferase
MNIDSNTGIWKNDTLVGHVHDEVLAETISRFLVREEIKEVYDFGCGHGRYTTKLREHGISCDGFDGNPHTSELTSGACGVLDLSQPFNLPPKEFVLTLEVGEHIPKAHEATFIDNVHRHNTRGIILSWAVPHQVGDGHVNCQTNDYVKGIFRDLGYTNDLHAESFLREGSSCSWYKNTLMVFRR